MLLVKDGMRIYVNRESHVMQITCDFHFFVVKCHNYVTIFSCYKMSDI